MKLLFDENLSDRLVRLLAHEFPGSTHVRLCGLAQADDRAVWEYARDNGLTIVSKDDDFRQRSYVHGPPPKVVWLRIGNCTTDEVADLLRERAADILAFDADPVAAVLAI